MKISLPLYEVRSYFKKLQEGEWVVLQTHYNKYVLDNPSLPGDYWARRLALSCMKLPYKLYPLRRRISNLNQLASSKAKKFINSEGKLINYVKEKLYNIELVPVMYHNQLYNGKWQNFTRKMPFPFVTDSPAEYLSLIKMGGQYLLFDVHAEKPEKRRYRVKL